MNTIAAKTSLPNFYKKNLMNLQNRKNSLQRISKVTPKKGRELSSYFKKYRKTRKFKMRLSYRKLISNAIKNLP